MFFYFKRHLQKAIFDKIKTDMAILVENPNIQVIFYFFKICRCGYQKIRLANHNSTQQRFVIIFKNMRSRRIKVEKNREITKSAVPQFFSSSLAIFHYFVKKKKFPLSLVWKDGSFDAISLYLHEKKNTLTGVFFHKRPFAMFNFDFSEKILL